jgi:hypothetical protein
MDTVDITRTHERKTVLMNWSIGRKTVFVRLLARERRNEVAPLTGDEKFSYSSLAGETLTWVTGERPGKLTYAGPDIFYGRGIPKATMLSETHRIYEEDTHRWNSRPRIPYAHFLAFHHSHLS